jgi:hypothetical protein
VRTIDQRNFNRTHASTTHASQYQGTGRWHKTQQCRNEQREREGNTCMMMPAMASAERRRGATREGAMVATVTVSAVTMGIIMPGTAQASAMTCPAWQSPVATASAIAPSCTLTPAFSCRLWLSGFHTSFTSCMSAEEDRVQKQLLHQQTRQRWRESGTNPTL